jgi:hypothetical protein
MKIIEYKVVKENKVMEYILEGWELQGSENGSENGSLKL